MTSRLPLSSGARAPASSRRGVGACGRRAGRGASSCSSGFGFLPGGRERGGAARGTHSRGRARSARRRACQLGTYLHRSDASGARSRARRPSAWHGPSARDGPSPRDGPCLGPSLRPCARSRGAAARTGPACWRAGWRRSSCAAGVTHTDDRGGQVALLERAACSRGGDGNGFKGVMQYNLRHHGAVWTDRREFGHGQGTMHHGRGQMRQRGRHQACSVY